MLQTAHFHVIGGAPKIKVFTAPSPGWVTIVSDGCEIFIGNAGLTLGNGFRMGQSTITLKLDGGDEIWAMSTSDTILYVIGQPD